eukprot:TRINITY_DN285_c0_g1_i1.p1 TRINITY_DN285_c0_g1~~TRINITY_DN285_c0_g1_i1.p1  ORF type:complete len:679 (-),score=177.83 TRINITY_DN285_c0_g1_i1:96-2132(-)
MWRALCVVVAWLGVVCASMETKKLAGPPSEFPFHELPDPVQGTLSSLSAFISVDLEVTGDEMAWKAEIPVDAEEVFMLTLLSPLEDDLTITLIDPTGKDVDLASLAQAGTFPLDEITVPATNYVLSRPVVGMYQVELSGPVRGAPYHTLSSSEPDAYLIWFNYATSDSVVLHTHLNTYENLHVGQQVGLVSYLTDAADRADTSNPNWTERFLISEKARLRDVVIVGAELSVVMPDGTEINEVMHDDGLHNDGDDDDDIYGGHVTASEPGLYTMQSTFYGKDDEGTVFVRSTQHLIQVVTDTAELTGTAEGTLNGDRLFVNVAVTSPVGASYKAYAQVWGTQGDTMVAACWVGGIVAVSNGQDAPYVQLEVDANWLHMAGLDAPIELREVRLQDVATSIPVATASSIVVTLPTGTVTALATFLSSEVRVTDITERMRIGVRPASFRLSGNSTAQDASGELILLHGYCAERNPWQEREQDFSNGNYFLNPKASVGHDAFAVLVNKYAQSLELKSYALIGHSQGGPVSVHLGNFYWSGLDIPQSGRLIQSVGSPYSGCSAAGSAANIGKLFGVGCGANHDLTVDGSRLWISGISMYYRQRTFYWTSTYLRNQALGDYCNLAINAILEWPNDGTSELAFTNLPNAYSMGNTDQQCHTVGMKYKPHYLDERRNADMNRNAARV